MFEDFKEKIKQNSSEGKVSSGLSPEIGAALRAQGLDPLTVTLEELFPATPDIEGNDLSLMSGLEKEILLTYWKTRKYLAEKYPAEVQVPDEAPDIDISRAREDPRSEVYLEALYIVVSIYKKLQVLQMYASSFEKICLRHYSHLTYNWTRAPNVGKFRSTLTDTDIFEAVDAYFKICRKYHVPTLEEPYYFLSEQQRLEIKLESDMLKRTGNYSEIEIHVSILEAFQ